MKLTKKDRMRLAAFAREWVEAVQKKSKKKSTKIKQRVVRFLSKFARKDWPDVIKVYNQYVSAYVRSDQNN